MKPIIEVNNLSKVYRLGNLGAKSFTDDIRSLWNKVRGKKEALDPKVLEQIKREGESDRINPERKNEFWALQDINFDIQPGEVVGIIGHNGAGKSTLLKILSRITEPSLGEVLLRGRVSSLLEVGTGFHPDLSGRENIYLNGAIHGMRRKEIDTKFEEIVDFAKVAEFIDTPVKRYSSGMYVRLAFAVAAFLEPEILIVDEVLAVGDADFQRKCLGKMKDVSQSGRTILFVSHNMAMITNICSRCILIEDGKVVEDGESAQVTSSYLSSSSSSKKLSNAEDDFAGFKSVNLLDEKKVRKGDKVVRIEDDFHIEFCFEVKKGGRKYIPNLHFYNSQGVLAFITSPVVNHSQNCKEYRLVVKVPKYFLNEGMYSIDVALSSFDDMQVVHFNIRGGLCITVKDDLLNNKYRNGSLKEVPGALRPVLEWEEVDL